MTSVSADKISIKTTKRKKKIAVIISWKVALTVEGQCKDFAVGDQYFYIWTHG